MGSAGTARDRAAQRARVSRGAEGPRVKSIEELKRMAEGFGGMALDELRKSGSLMQKFHLIGEGKIEIICSAGDVTNSEKAKGALAAQLRARIAEGDIEAVVMVSDVWITNITPEANKIKSAFRMNVEQAAAAGLCEKREAFICSLESPLYCQLTTQMYRREADRVVLDGPPEISVEDGRSGEKPNGRHFGRFMSFWPHQAGA
jgi:hypothetical protein